MIARPEALPVRGVSIATAADAIRIIGAAFSGLAVATIRISPQQGSAPGSTLSTMGSSGGRNRSIIRVSPQHVGRADRLSGRRHPRRQIFCANLDWPGFPLRRDQEIDGGPRPTRLEVERSPVTPGPDGRV